MKKLIFLMAWITFLTGCASPFCPTKFVTSFQCESNLESTLAAKCIMDNVNSQRSDDFRVLAVEEGVRPHQFQMQIRAPHDEYAGIFEIEPTISGSLVTGRYADDYIATNGKLLKTYTKGCCAPPPLHNDICCNRIFPLSADEGFCISPSSYNATVKSINELLPWVSSNVRKESYSFIKFNRCIFGYNVSGFYPVGTPYDIQLSNIDFSSLNYQASKTGVDYSHYIVLNFKNPIIHKNFSDERTVHTVVIDAASYEQAQTLFKAFLQLGEICGAEPGS